MDGRVMRKAAITGETADSISFEYRLDGTKTSVTLPKRIIHRVREKGDDEWRVITPRPEPDEPEPEPEPVVEAEPPPPPEPKAPPFFGWRGDGTGCFGDGLEPPTSWDQTSHVAWKRELPTWGSGSPCLFGDAILVAREPHRLLCIERTDGTIRWQVENPPPEVLGSGEDPGEEDPKGLRGWTMATPATDGQHIWVAFGQGMMVCFDAHGERVWGEPLNTVGRWGAALSASPLLWEGLVLQQSADGLVAFAQASGKRVWSAGFSSHLLGTGCFMQLGGQDHLVSTEGHLVRLADGRQLSGKVVEKPWQNWGPSAVVHQDIAVLHLHGKPKNSTCVRAYRYSATGEAEQLWEVVPDPDYNYFTRMGNSPVIHHGIYYAVTDGGFLVAIEVESGEVLFTHKWGKNNYSSIAQAGDFIYINGKDRMHVIAAGREFESIADFDPGFKRPEARPWLLISTPIFVDKEIYAVDLTHLWCIRRDR